MKGKPIKTPFPSTPLPLTRGAGDGGEPEWDAGAVLEFKGHEGQSPSQTGREVFGVGVERRARDGIRRL